MDDNKAICKRLRREFNKSGWALLIYYGVMNLAVFFAGFASVLAGIGRTVFDPLAPEPDLDLLLDMAFRNNGWGYLLGILIGSLLMFLWKKKEFCLKTVWKAGKSMTIGTFFALLAVFFGIQAVSQAMTPLLEWLFGLMGISLTEVIASASASTDSVSMFLYVCLLAPISEEILFRGLILRSVEPYGRKFAILASSFLFGIFHGNLIQTPYAFLAGLVLGYAAMEYNILWAMLLHVLNNLFLGDILLRLTGHLSDFAQQLMFAAVIWGSAVAAVGILIARRKAVGEWFSRGKIHPLCLKSFFTSPGILILTAVLLGNILLTLLLQAV